MFKKNDYIYFKEIINKILELENVNRQINEKKLSKASSIKSEKINEFIATNNIEGDVVSFDKAKYFLKNEENISKSSLEKRWMGIKYASDFTWSKNYIFNLESIHEAHRALMRHSSIPDGIWKTKINQVGSLVTAHPDDVSKLMFDLMNTYLSSKISEGASIFNIIPFISEFLAIHPYEDGNGRMSRLIMNVELYNAGFRFVKYISISKFLWAKREEYINSLESRNAAWRSNKLQPSDLVPFFNVVLDSLINAAKKAIDILKLKHMKKEEFNLIILKILNKEMSISQIIAHLKISNSNSSIQKWLKELVVENKIKLVGTKKSSKYIKN